MATLQLDASLLIQSFDLGFCDAFMPPEVYDECETAARHRAADKVSHQQLVQELLICMQRPGHARLTDTDAGNTETPFVGSATCRSPAGLQETDLHVDAEAWTHVPQRYMLMHKHVPLGSIADAGGAAGCRRRGCSCYGRANSRGNQGGACAFAAVSICKAAAAAKQVVQERSSSSTTQLGSHNHAVHAAWL